MKQKDKIKEFIDNLCHPAMRDYKLDYKLNLAIQFGSQLTAERAKEKVEKLEIIMYDEVLQAIEESVIK